MCARCDAVMKEEWLQPEEQPDVTCVGMVSALRAVTEALGDPRAERWERLAHFYPPLERRRA